VAHPAHDVEGYGEKTMMLFLTAILFFSSTLQAESKKTVLCTKDDAIRAEEEASSLGSWSDVYKSYEKYRQCDDGAIAEGYSDSIAHLLSGDWGSMPELNRLTSNDKRFESFILNHIDELMSPIQQRRINENATTRCPAKAKELCSAIMTRIKTWSLPPQQ
jgi:hypothetical protein